MLRLIILTGIIPVFLQAQTTQKSTLLFSGFAGINTTFISNHASLFNDDQPYPTMVSPTISSNIENVRLRPGFQLGMRCTKPHKTFSFAFSLFVSHHQAVYDCSRTWAIGNKGEMDNAVWRGTWLNMELMAQLKPFRNRRIKFLGGLSPAVCVFNANSGWMMNTTTITSFSHSNNSFYTASQSEEYTMKTKIDNLNFSFCGGLEIPVTGQDKKPFSLLLMYYKGLSNLSSEVFTQQNSIQVSGVYYFNY